MFADSVLKAKKQMENSIAIFKELILRRKKKLLNLIFIATETGIMKKDYENMLDYEKKVFDEMIKSIETGDKELNGMLNGKKEENVKKDRMVMFSQPVEEFMDNSGGTVGPFASGELANLSSQVAEILIEAGKASYVDEN
jgi:hypothetical protein